MDKDVIDVQAAAIAFDQQDRVVGGGYGFLSFIPAFGQSPVSVGLIVSGQPAKVEIFPGASGLWSVREASTVAPALKLIRSGFSQDRQQAHYAFFVENPNQQAAAQSVRFQVAAYDADGNPLEAASGDIPLLLPGERLGISGCMFLPENSLASRIEVQILPGEYTPLQKLSNPPLSTVQVSYSDSSGTGRTVGIIRNSLNRAVSNVQVYAVAYDMSGNLIGGGSSFLNSIDGNSDATVEIAISCAGTPARVELYPAMTDLAAIVR
jgi:hypothetical protein